MINLKACGLGLAVIGSTLPVVTLATAPAMAVTGFTFTTVFTPNPADPTRDILLQQAITPGGTYSAFSLVDGANIISNNGASSDHGDNTVSDPFLPQGPAVEDPTNADIVASLGNLNLNSIIDSEESGSYTIDLFFSSPTKTFLFWERGLNSDIRLSALDAAGALTGETFTITRNLWTPAGFNINTTELNGTAGQPVGSYGLTFGSNVYGLRVITTSRFNGPDFKVVGAVPEPFTMLGAGAALGFGALFKRQASRKKGQDNKDA